MAYHIGATLLVRSADAHAMPHPLHIVDVFARDPYAGNQLAVLTDAGDLSTDEMQAVAAEMDYSETTFVTGPPEAGAWPVRIFTPNAEIPFAGHPTLGTAAVIRDHLADGRPDTVTLDPAVRVFAPFYGVPEDPATGSSNGCLAAYLARQRGSRVDARVEQGYEMGRPSLLSLRADATGDDIRVEVGGSVAPTVRGELL